MKFKSKKKGVSQYYKGKKIAVFRDYSFETEDKEVVDALIELGYECDGEIAEEKEMPDADIRQKAKELGIKSWHVKGINKLIKEIAKKENE